MGLDGPAIGRYQERRIFEDKDPATGCPIVKWKVSMATSILIFMIGIHEVQDQEITPRHGTPGLDQMFLVMIHKGRSTQ